MLLSVVIPAFNEELYLQETLSRLHDAISLCPCCAEIIVGSGPLRSGLARGEDGLR